MPGLDPETAASEYRVITTFVAFFLLLVVAAMDDDADEATGEWGHKARFHFGASVFLPAHAMLFGSHAVVWRALSDDNGVRAPRPSDYFEGARGVTLRAGCQGAACGFALWALALLACENHRAKRLARGSPLAAAIAAATRAEDQSAGEGGGGAEAGRDASAETEKATLRRRFRRDAAGEFGTSSAAATPDGPSAAPPEGTIDTDIEPSSSAERAPPLAFAALGVTAAPPQYAAADERGRPGARGGRAAALRGRARTLGTLGTLVRLRARPVLRRLRPSEGPRRGRVVLRRAGRNRRRRRRRGRGRRRHIRAVAGADPHHGAAMFFVPLTSGGCRARRTERRDEWYRRSG